MHGDCPWILFIFAFTFIRDLDVTTMLNRLRSVVALVINGHLFPEFLVMNSIFSASCMFINGFKFIIIY